MTERQTCVITGMGVVAPCGIGEGALWQAAVTGSNHVGRITLFDPADYPVQTAAEVPGFDAEAYLASNLAPQMDRWSHLGMAASAMALESAGLPAQPDDPYSAGVCLASSSGGNIFGQQEQQRLWRDDRRSVSAYQSIAWFYAATVGQASIRHQHKYQSTVLASEAAGAIDSVAQAARCVRRGGEVVLAGGTECPLSPYAVVCHLEGGMLTTTQDETYHPYTDAADGHVLGEGGAVFAVEDLRQAATSFARVRARISGWGATHDAADWRTGDIGHEHLAGAIDLALRRAGLGPEDIAAVVPDALGVAAFDRAEARALASVGVTAPVTSLKPSIGRATQGGGALDIALAVLMLQHRTIPPFGGSPPPDAGFGLDLCRRVRPLRGDHVLVVARGRDGFNSALVLTAPDPAGDGVLRQPSKGVQS